MSKEGVRMGAFGRLPSVIETESAAGDIIHICDIFMTYARIGQAIENIPHDRFIGGVDQSALLLECEGDNRRALTGTQTPYSAHQWLPNGRSRYGYIRGPR
jgi:hypothetical protein